MSKTVPKNPNFRYLNYELYLSLHSESENLKKTRPSNHKILNPEFIWISGLLLRTGSILLRHVYSCLLYLFFSFHNFHGRMIKHFLPCIVKLPIRRIWQKSLFSQCNGLFGSGMNARGSLKGCGSRLAFFLCFGGLFHGLKVRSGLFNMNSS